MNPTTPTPPSAPPRGTITDLLPKCAGCAFMPGTDANRAPITQLTASLCVDACVPFYCHANASKDGVLPDGEQMLCRGFVEAMEEKKTLGSYDVMPRWKRRVLLGCLEAIERCTKKNMSEGETMEVISEELARAQVTQDCLALATVDAHEVAAVRMRVRAPSGGDAGTTTEGRP